MGRSRYRNPILILPPLASIFSLNETLIHLLPSPTISHRIYLSSDLSKVIETISGNLVFLIAGGNELNANDAKGFGKRTVQGILKDAWNVLTLYYLNNFVNGTKQDSIDLLQGLIVLQSFSLALAVITMGFLCTHAR
ncbi:hypothetical protein L1987_74761 [Smallanthus sonchifolius]|uniref:Uncharacterized protein n=1 Tax=Smallanthus sonchifolius TaxID=185202 RepID=A0ACB9A581_9ASTR|nr:hypothetical protein L1987_74761 [Smallanthus sonchifolius]